MSAEEQRSHAPAESPTSSVGREVVDQKDRKFSPKDFMFGTTLGEGAYARVVHGKLKSSNRNSGDEFAVKIMEKAFIRKEGKVKFVMMEKTVLSRLHSGLVVKLYFTFQDKGYLYMAMELCKGGELLELIKLKLAGARGAGLVDQALSNDMAQFYTAETVLALKYLHEHGVVHRDLKPENVLITSAGHLKLTDFGTAKDEKEEGRHNTFCGTADYVSPEVLRDMEAGRGCDLWALGVMLFQMLVGRPLFRADSEYLTFQLILNHPAPDFAFPQAVGREARDLITRLLVQEPTLRLGAGAEGSNNDYVALMSHPFFEGVCWESLVHQQAPYQPATKKLPAPTFDGAQEDWLFEGVATELHSEANQIQPQQMKKSLATIPPIVGDGMRDADIQLFLLPGECVRLTGLVLKRKGLFSKKRQLILTSTPRLIYIDSAKMEWKGEISWEKPLALVAKNLSQFDVMTPRRKYHLTDLSNLGVVRWTEAILQAQSRITFPATLPSSPPSITPRSLPFQHGLDEEEEEEEDGESLHVVDR